jgi:hypothetical protein
VTDVRSCVHALSAARRGRPTRIRARIRDRASVAPRIALARIAGTTVATSVGVAAGILLGLQNAAAVAIDRVVDAVLLGEQIAPRVREGDRT